MKNDFKVHSENAPNLALAAVYGTPILAIIFCLNLAIIIDKAHHDKDFKLKVYLMTGAFTIMVS